MRAPTQTDRVFDALGDPTRRAILERMSKDPMPASALVKPLGMTLAGVVQHLQVLEACGLISSKKEGRVRTCQIQPKGLSIAMKWISERQAQWERRLDALADLLNEDDETDD
ncbi:MAG TPA: metalloregulator ArsR/SmtB family transcription factor [Kofleriaceae bacterium]|jgi:DNA-binding transcriptional ArsR family regulator